MPGRALERFPVSHWSIAIEANPFKDVNKHTSKRERGYGPTNIAINVERDLLDALLAFFFLSSKKKILTGRCQLPNHD